MNFLSNLSERIIAKFGNQIDCLPGINKPYFETLFSILRVYWLIEK